jgi:hypothetical protein
MVKRFFQCSREKWHLGIKMAKMVTNGGPRKHLIRAFRLSKEWSPPHEPGKTTGRGIYDLRFFKKSGIDIELKSLSEVFLIYALGEKGEIL